MRSRSCLPWLGMATLLAAGTPADGTVQAAPEVEGIRIEHAGVDCVVAEQFPSFEAHFDPADRVREARLRFRPEGGRDWYSVAMQASGDTFSGILPKPKKSLARLDYYIEVTGASLESTRTEEYSPRVVAGPGACQDKKVATAMGTAAVSIVAPAGLSGAPLVPAGFSTAGVTAAGSTTATGAASGAASGGGGGLSTTALAIGGGVAAAAVVVVATGGDESASLPTGTFSGSASDFRETVTWNAGLISCVDITQWEVRISIDDQGGTASFVVNNMTRVCPDPVDSESFTFNPGPAFEARLTVSGATVTGSASYFRDARVELQGTRDGGRISGTYTIAPSAGSNGGSGTFWGGGSGTFSVTKVD